MRVLNQTLFSPKASEAEHYWLALGLDMDGCFFNEDYLDKREAMLQEKGTLTDEEEIELLIACNQQALDAIIKAAASYKKLLVLLFSNRQDKRIDATNCRLNQTMSGIVAHKAITDYLKSKLPNTDVEQVTFLMADHSIGKEADINNIGAAYRQIFENTNGASYASWGGFNHAKFTLCYAHAHLLAHLRQQADTPPTCINYCILDDRDDILQGVEEFVVAASSHLPNDVALTFINYSIDSKAAIADTLKLTPHQLSKSFRGKGQADAHFMSTLRSLEAKLSTSAYDLGKSKLTYNELTFFDVQHAVTELIKHKPKVEEKLQDSSWWSYCTLQ